MFIENKYTRWYRRIIETAKGRVNTGYVEKHHIIPRCLGGDNSKNNLVKLTAREHFICHWLLCKMINEEYKYKLYHAFSNMSRSSKSTIRQYTSRQYSLMKKYKAEAASKQFKNKPKSLEHRQKISEANKGAPKSEDAKQKMSLAKKGKYIPWNKGKPHSFETKQKIASKKKGLKLRDDQKNKWKNWIEISCPYCSKKSKSAANMKRWHFNNCKNYPSYSSANVDSSNTASTRENR